MRASFRYAARQDWDKISRGLKPIYTAPTAKAAEDRFLEFQEAWGEKYPAIVRLWENSWSEFVPFLQFDTGIRRIVCTTNAIESVNARIRKAVRARGHFPNEAAALKCVYMAVMSLDPTGQGRKRWTLRWKPALQAFDIAFDGRLSIGRRQLSQHEIHQSLGPVSLSVVASAMPRLYTVGPKMPVWSIVVSGWRSMPLISGVWAAAPHTRGVAVMCTGGVLAGIARSSWTVPQPSPKAEQVRWASSATTRSQAGRRCCSWEVWMRCSEP